MNNFNFSSFLIFLFRKPTNYSSEPNQPLDITPAKARKNVKCNPLSPLANLLITMGPGSYAGACFTK